VDEELLGDNKKKKDEINEAFRVKRNLLIEQMTLR
jgi:hypothetical protein